MMDCIHMHQCISYLSLADKCSIWLQHFALLYFKVCQPGSKTQLMDGKSMKNKTLILVSRVHQTCILDCTLFFQNWEHLGGRCITYLNATRHISVCLNIPIYSKTVSALLEWIMDGKSRHWVIRYDTIRFCLSHYVSLWDWLTDEQSWFEAHNFTPNSKANMFDSVR